MDRTDKGTFEHGWSGHKHCNVCEKDYFAASGAQVHCKPDMKECTVCHELKPRTTEFFRHKAGRPDGQFMSLCISCELQKNRERSHKPENRKRRAEQRLKQYHEDPEPFLERQRAYYLRNRETRLTYQHKYNVETNRYENNKDKHREWTRAWRRANPAKIRALVNAYKARRKGAEGSYNSRDIEKLFWFQDGTCQYCDIKLTSENMTVDHMIPLSRGGPNNPSNLCLACLPCNSRKGAKTHNEFFAELDMKVS